MNKHIIQPRFSLPMNTKRKRKWASKRIAVTVLGITSMTGLLGLLLYRVLAPWPVYCIVAFIAVAIISSNVLSEMIRRIFKQQTLTLLGNASHWYSVSKIREHSDDLLRSTTGFLVAIRKTYIP